ncbi:transposase [uncultured Sphingomonas sp.]|uniref:transposase n=1 Tax=uncultured Sphingomonas sp. TaxID=158754 RepID=UPI0035CB9596
MGLLATIFVIRNGLRWREAPAEYGTPKTIYNRFIRWSRLGVLPSARRQRGCSPTYRMHQRRPELISNGRPPPSHTHEASKVMLGNRGHDAD